MLVVGAHRAAENDRAVVGVHRAGEGIAAGGTADVEAITLLLQQAADASGVRALLMQHHQDAARAGSRLPHPRKVAEKFIGLWVQPAVGQHRIISFVAPDLHEAVTMVKRS